MDSLARLLSTTSQVCELIEKIEQKEAQMGLHEQSKIYLDESLTLHGDISSKTKVPQQHAVYTLHERYARYSEFSEALGKLRASLDQKIDTFEAISKSQMESLKFIKS